MTQKKELFVIRHAKSSWDIEGISDRDRPLKLRGIRNAYEMARRLKIDLLVPGKIITSPANRALHTASIFVNVFEMPYTVLTVDDRLYGGGTLETLRIIKEQPDELERLMIFGHNPDFTEVVRVFTKQTILELPTCGMGIFTFECDRWSDIGVGNLVDEKIEIPQK